MNGNDITVNVLEKNGCSDPFMPEQCTSIYTTTKTQGEMDIKLTPGNNYYLQFHDEAFLFPTKEVRADFQLISET